MKSKKLMLIALLLMVSVCLFGGGKKESADTVKKAEDLHVALIVKNLVNPFFVYMKYGGEAAANKYGVKYTCLAPEVSGDVEAQIRIMEDLIIKGVDAIVVVPIDSKGIIPGIEQANKAGVPVFVSNTRAKGGDIVAFAGIDHVQMAEEVGGWVVKELKGKGKIIEIEGKTGAQSSIDRKTGFENTFSKESGIERLAITPADYNKSKAMQIMEDLLVRFDDIDAVVCYNDSMALGVVEALKAAGRLDKTLVTGCDANKDALDSIKMGELSATVDSNPVMQTFVPVEKAINYLLDGTVPPKDILVGDGKPAVVDEKNVEKFEADTKANLKKYNVEF